MGNRSIANGGTSKRTIFIRALAVALAFALAALVVLQRSDSAFSGQTSMNGDLSTGTVALSNTPQSTPLNVANLIPGDSVQRCVMVNYTGSTAAAQLLTVKGYGGYVDGVSGLASYLDTKVEVGAAGKDCSNFVASGSPVTGKMDAIISAHRDYSTGIDSGWKPAAGDLARAFRFTVTLPSDVNNSAQGKQVKPVATWEIQTGAGSAR